MRARGLVKHYGNVCAVRGSDFEIRAGEVLAVVGDAGAGKTSLIKALSGAMVPDRGTIELDGRPVDFRGPADARALGIETVHQALALSPQLSVFDNIYIGRRVRRPGPLGWLGMADHRRMSTAAERQLAALGIAAIEDIRQPASALSGSQQQAVALARATMFGGRLIIMDEPTARLGAGEAHRVLDLIACIRDHGIPVVIVSHDMPQVFQIADRIHIHRLGRRVALLDPAWCSMTDAVGLITGALRLDQDGQIVQAARPAPTRVPRTAFVPMEHP
ncbi:ATP-binding cassette domain-containing protein [Streptomyces sp. NPDC007929]|uniref:ATP-binding cassette domain-containing protein n=1 Tax=unclassified Streptomyces TaxID=2593676 RepID=UPI0036E10BF0